MPSTINRSALYADGVELRASILRFLPAAFLTFWLCGWLVGEVLVIGVLVSSLASLAGVELPALVGLEMAQMEDAVPWFVSVFLLVWLAGWTFGGVAAFRQLWKLLTGRERVFIESGTLVVERFHGPFSKRHRWDTQRITEVEGDGGEVSVSVNGRESCLVRTGSRVERKALVEALRDALGLTATQSEASDSMRSLRRPS